MNTNTWIILAALLLILLLALRSVIKSRRSGCGGACAGCACQGKCGSAQENHDTTAL